MDLIEKIRAFVRLQVALVSALKSMLGGQDWTLLVGVPKAGVVNIDDDEWSYQRHGVGIRFERRGVVVDANRHLDQDPGLFDVGRLVEFLQTDSDPVLVRAEPVALDFTSVSELLDELEADGRVQRVRGMSGEIFRLNT